MYHSKTVSAGGGGQPLRTLSLAYLPTTPNEEMVAHLKENTQDSQARKHELEQLLCKSLHKGQHYKEDPGKSHLVEMGL